ncbi:bifunctional DNA-formamidopyrimidine glycosylase/DNA-(apurinic or apyrimidinic site) lyase [Serinibacter salmoneus]|uniref:Formamidopyrimidine-DNA glycosylase n=1 Tax=Serinibacter salmoneus TaxID=556530 RepID=A0A2A9D2Q5_9MICO|nr:bifunctional DNA-formamidopyrimidine glycosylase/DNA-(apurinic or apyrimidinic site) lyase [Serinibacter salmoneus]PFG20129.1 DNA-(apurinic or apyrimidinic site) lyase [Serinibacter salmoneus]
MPELPEVETVRDGVARHALNRTISRAAVLSERTSRRFIGGRRALGDALQGHRFDAAVRRGKYLWLTLAGSGDADGTSAPALLVHLGMSGQLLVRDEVGAAARHLRARLEFDDGGALDFVDQRTFGYLTLEPLVPTPDGAPGGLGSDVAGVPAPVAHIARDLLDPALDRAAVSRRICTKRTAIKRALLDQTVVSGVGNIYADEALWRARVHPERACDELSARAVTRVLGCAAEVMTEALAQGGTSFDELYVNVNGASGYFDRSLAVYGQGGRPCPRCGTLVVRQSFANRSSHLCPRCQRRPRSR